MAVARHTHTHLTTFLTCWLQVVAQEVNAQRRAHAAQKKRRTSVPPTDGSQSDNDDDVDEARTQLGLQLLATRLQAQR